jgi:hypothetical protein
MLYLGKNRYRNWLSFASTSIVKLSIHLTARMPSLTCLCRFPCPIGPSFACMLCQSFPRSCLITGFVIRVTRRFPLVEQELLILPEHLRYPKVFSGVRVARSLVLCGVFCRSMFILLSFFFWPLCFLSFFDLRLLITLWNLQTFLIVWNI